MIPERLVPGTAEWRLYIPEHRQRYEFFAAECAGKSVLDAACGVGYGSRMLAEAGAASVLGVDLSEQALALARTQFAHPRVEYARRDVALLDGLGPFDRVISFETIEHVAEPELFVRAVRRAIADDGLFVCSTPNRDFHDQSKESNPYHLSCMGFEEFAAVFGKYFQIEAQYQQSHSVSYLRHIALVKELDRIRKRVEFSRILRLENRLRKILGREIPDSARPSEFVQEGIPDDFVIEPLTSPSDQPVTYILTGRPIR
ncbi:MAG TPA: methyltransferase domain-containing protein [Bryobacteraceae bacterium]|jgi:2-polyprenyl-3-methyl-5-hydroxy-6-metoxy-1,4-benzoquinol methylase|nr:methyltransferase domain-containing protein [Bryobacteraceae bacterium]